MSDQAADEVKGSPYDPFPVKYKTVTEEEWEKLTAERDTMNAAIWHAGNILYQATGYVGIDSEPGEIIRATLTILREARGVEPDASTFEERLNGPKS